jgi:hypothetical protein
MSDREARNDASALVACNERHYGATQRSSASGNTAAQSMEHRDSRRENGVEGAADREVFLFKL